MIENIALDGPRIISTLTKDLRGVIDMAPMVSANNCSLKVFPAETGQHSGLTRFRRCGKRSDANSAGLRHLPCASLCIRPLLASRGKRLSPICSSSAHACGTRAEP